MIENDVQKSNRKESGPFFLEGGSLWLSDLGTPSACFTILWVKAMLTDLPRIPGDGNVAKQNSRHLESPRRFWKWLMSRPYLPPRSILCSYDETGSLECAKKRCHKICRNMFLISSWKLKSPTAWACEHNIKLPTCFTFIYPPCNACFIEPINWRQ